jgi:hemerythrin-like metal-binding protein
MALMDWSDALVDGVASIDTQHHELVDLMNALYDSAAAGEGAVTVRLFDKLLEHTVAHFRHEETLFINTAYPDADRHRRHHHLLTAKAIEYRDCAAAGNFQALTAEILPKLRDFLVFHIQKDDKETCAFLNTQGIC